MVDSGVLGALHGLFILLNLCCDLIIAAAAFVVCVVLQPTPNRVASVWLCAGAAGSALATVLSTVGFYVQVAMGAGLPGVGMFVLTQTMSALGLLSVTVMGVGLWRLQPSAKEPEYSAEGRRD